MPRSILFHKPYGVLSQFSGRSPNLGDCVSVKDVYPAGRLDHDSEGLMLLTSDGALQHRLTDPRHAHPRTYWAQVEGVPEAADLQRLRAGVMVQGRRTLPARVERLDREPDLAPRNPPIRFRKTVPTSWIEITLTEGRNRQVRRMTAAVAHPTLRLVRVAIGNLRLGDLAPGAWRDLTKDELNSLRTSETRPRKQ
ncbi:MAG TPA: pseudouridine synthase [Terriglobales bacterium]|nr:pseudouridine synthase [Terriglobales bacterium]